MALPSIFEKDKDDDEEDDDSETNDHDHSVAVSVVDCYWDRPGAEPIVQVLILVGFLDRFSLDIRVAKRKLVRTILRCNGRQ